MKFPAGRLALILALLLFLFFGDAPEFSRFWSAFFDAGHTALFGVIALAVHGWLAGTAGTPARGAPAVPGASAPRASRFLAAFAITVILGAATEVLQTLQARGDPSIADLLRDTAGASAFLLLAWAAPRRLGQSFRPARWRAMAAVAALVLLVAAGWTLLLTSARYVARNHAYPTLFALDGSWWEASFIDLEGNRLTPGALDPPEGTPERRRFARLDLRPNLYSGVVFEEPYPDWTGRDYLTITIISELDAPLPMAIRVHDAAHDQRYRDRFNRRLTVVPGVNRVRIPIEEVRNAPDRRRMDLRRIRGVLLFAYDLRKPVHLFLGPLRLE